jgi:hypothetical protein
MPGSKASENPPVGRGSVSAGSDIDRSAIATGENSQAYLGGVHRHVHIYEREIGSATSRPFQVPPLPPHYVERDALAPALSRLVGGHGRGKVLSISALHGQGGIGKTTLAAAIARSEMISERYSDGVLWASLGPEPQVLNELLSWLHAVGEFRSVAWTVQSASGYLRTWLEDRAVLLVIDDVWRPEDARPFLVGGGNCSVLITTRRSHITDDLGAEPYPIGTMSLTESLDLLAGHDRAQRSQPHSEMDQGQAKALVEELGYLPLALGLVRGLLARNYSLQEVRNLVRADGQPRYVNRAMQKVERSLSVSLDVVARENQLAHHAFMWICLTRPGVHINPAICSNLLGVSPDVSAGLLADLSDESLLRRDGDNYSIHGLLQEICQRYFTALPPTGFGKTLSEGHAYILQRYYTLSHNRTWDSIPDDGYIHDNLLWHLKHAGYEKEAISLLTGTDVEGRNRWFQA